MVPNEQFVDIPDLDVPIYRVFSNQRLFEVFGNKQLALVAPRLWEDPFENFLASCRARLASSGGHASLSGIFKNTFGQCWTFNRDSDAMWRIYSSGKTGAKVRTTPRNLLSAIYDPQNPFAHMSYFIGKVSYLEEADIRQIFQNPQLSSSIAFDPTGHNQIIPLLIKRMEFEHEAEVRLIFRYNKEGDDSELPNPVWPFPIEPASLFDEVVFDPRIDDVQFAQDQSKLQHLGFAGKIGKSPLYKVPNLVININV